MKKQMAFVLSLGVIACTKQNDPSRDPNGGVDKPIDTVNLIMIQSYKIGQGYDTAGNYIASFHFMRRYPHLTFDRVGDTTIGIAGYTATKSDDMAKYVIRYVGGMPFVKTADLAYRFPEQDCFYLDKGLLGKPIFEIYDVKTNQLVKRLICGRDSAEVQFSYTVWANPNIEPQQNVDALIYYLTTKQTDGLHYY